MIEILIFQEEVNQLGMIMIHTTKILERGVKPFYRFGRVDIKDEGLVRTIDEHFGLLGERITAKGLESVFSNYSAYVAVLKWGPDEPLKVPLVLIVCEMTCELIRAGEPEGGWGSLSLIHPLRRLPDAFDSIISDSSANLQLRIIALEAERIVTGSLQNANLRDILERVA